MPNRLRVPFSLILLLALVCGHTHATAQCEPEWLAGDARPTLGGQVNTSALWDPDGAGPAVALYVVGGDLDVGTSFHAGVATYDGTRWTWLGGLSRWVTALGVHNGQLHAARNVPGNTSQVHVWDGVAWQLIGTVTGEVRAMTSFGGQLLIGGQFSAVGGISVSGIARWNGTAWSSMGSIQGEVRAFAVFNGTLYAGGSITSGALTPGLVIWNGSAWIVGPVFNGAVNALAVRTSVAAGQSFLFVGGDFTALTIGAQTVPAQRVARFEPVANAWTGVSGGVPLASLDALLVRAVGVNGYELVACGYHLLAAQRVWRLSGATWTNLAGPPGGQIVGWPTTIAFYAGRYTVGLDSSVPIRAVGAWDGTAWVDMFGQGIVGSVQAVEPAGSDLVIAGSFTTIDNVTVNGIARGSAGNWAPLGGGVTGGGGLGVLALCTAANGDVVAAGDFTIAGGVPANGIARWNGTTWSALGGGLTGGVVRALLTLPNGDIVAGGDFTLAGGAPASRAARWDGSQWSALGWGFNGAVRALALLPSGNIVAGGSFTVAGPSPAGCIAEFSGGNWQPLGSGFNSRVSALALAPNGDLYAGGSFSSVGGSPATVARWSNGSWFPMNPNGVFDVNALHVHLNGDLFIGGYTFLVTTGVNIVSTNLVRVSNGFTSPEYLGGDVEGESVFDITMAGSDLVVGGLFDEAGSVISANVARLHAPCPATATPYGAGCSGLTAPLALTALEAPWLGGAWRLRASTFGPNSFAVRLLGFAQLNLPLAPILPGSLPGCVGLLTPDVLWLDLPNLGQLTISTPVPFYPTLVGAQAFQQVLQFESAPGGGFAISSSNGVQLTVGSF